MSLKKLPQIETWNLKFEFISLYRFSFSYQFSLTISSYFPVFLIHSIHLFISKLSFYNYLSPLFPLPTRPFYILYQIKPLYCKGEHLAFKDWKGLRFPHMAFTFQWLSKCRSVKPQNGLVQCDRMLEHKVAQFLL